MQAFGKIRERYKFLLVERAEAAGENAYSGRREERTKSRSAVKILGDETLKTIARELVDTVRKNTSIDWTVKQSVKAKLRIMVKRILRKYGYAPDKQEHATATVLEQAELLCKDWAA